MAADEPTVVAKLVAEFTGTFLLVFTIGCNVMCKTAVWAGVSIACVLMVSIYAFGGISGANFNPAVSITLGITKALGGPGMAMKDVIMYCGVQVLAGMIAGCCYLVMFGDAFNLTPAKGHGILAAGTCELLYTCMLCFVVLNVAVAKKNGETDIVAVTVKRDGADVVEEVQVAKNENEYYGLAIGFVIVAGAYGAGAVSGGCFNPAVAIGVDVSSAQYGIGWFLVYWVFEILGAFLAAFMFMMVRPGDFGEGEEDYKHPPTLQEKLASEFLGSFFLVLTVGLNVLGKSPAGAFSIAASLMCMIFALGDVSGAHFNPAVTLSIMISGLDANLNAKAVILYMLAQIAGGIAAAYTYTGIYYGASFPLGPGTGYTWVQVAVAEIVFTFVLCVVVLGAAVSKKTQTTTMFGLAIGSCVTVGGVAIGGISGGSLNPAVSFGIAASQVLNGGLFYKALIYSIFEFIGAVAAASVVIVTHPHLEKAVLPISEAKKS